MKSILFACALAAGFVGGVYCGHFRTFPFRHLVKIKTTFVPGRVVPSMGEPTAFVIRLDTEDAVRDQRARLIRYVWGEDALPARLPDRVITRFSERKYRCFEANASLERWIVNMSFGIDSKILVIVPKRQTQRTAVIYHQGHEGDVTESVAVISRLSKAGFFVVAIAMPLLGPNSRPRVDFDRHGSVALADHNFFPLLDHEYGIHSVRFFLEPVVVGVNELRARGFDRIAMIGSSGGGWTTTLCAALDKRIEASFPVAGSLPFSLRGSGEMGDYEQHLPELYAISNYPELHVLGVHERRFQLQILNYFDTAGMGGARGGLYQQSVWDALSALHDTGYFEVMIDSSWTGHGISMKALRRVIYELSRTNL